MFLKNILAKAKETKDDRDTIRQQQLDRLEKRTQEKHIQLAVECIQKAERIKVRNGADPIEARLETLRQEQQYLESIKG